MPSYATNAPQGYMGDWERGAPMGRPTIAPDPRTVADLGADFVAACTRLDVTLRLREDRPADGFKASAWEAAAQHWREERERLRALYKAAQERDKPTTAPMISLQRVRLDSGGYDPQGAYFGIGEPLYWAADDAGEYDATFRAADREAAKAHVREAFPHARFHR